MEALIAWTAAATLFTTGWYLLGYGEARAAGAAGLIAGLFLLSTAAIASASVPATGTAQLALALILGLYFVNEGAVSLWNLGARTAGMLTGFAASAIGVIALIMILNALSSATYDLTATTLGVAAALFTLPAGIRFIELGLDRPRLRRLSGWLYVLSAWIGWAIPAAILTIHDVFG